MQFSLFVHMERVDNDESYSKMHEDFIQLCQLADEAGMSTIWTGEHHGMDFTIAPNPFITLVDIARYTKNIRLGTGTVIAPFWHPVKLAGEAAMTDIATQGRLELGIARGAYSYEYERISPGLDAWQAGMKMREIIPAVKALWQGDYAHNGEHYQFPSTSVVPKPVQKDGPPVWVAARDPNTHAFAIENQCNIQVTPLWQGMQEIENLMKTFKQAKADFNPQSKSKIMLLQHAYVTADDKNAADDIEQAAKELSRFYCQFGAWFKNERQVSQGRIDPLTQEEMDKITMYSPEVMKESMPIGTPAQVTERLKQYEQMGYDEFSFWIDSGMTTQRKKASLQRFIDDVMPKFS